MNETGRPPGISGRRVTAAVLIALVAVGGWLSYVLWSYNEIDQARAATSTSWLSLANQLSARYSKIESQIARGVDDQSIDMAFGERFRLVVDRFRTTAQGPLQYATALELEQLLAEETSVRSALPAPTPELASAIEAHNQLLATERGWLDSPGGKFLSIFLKFSEPEQFALTP